MVQQAQRLFFNGIECSILDAWIRCLLLSISQE